MNETRLLARQGEPMSQMVKNYLKVQASDFGGCRLEPRKNLNLCADCKSVYAGSIASSAPAFKSPAE